MMQTLPAHMQNISSRHALHQKMGRSMVEINSSQQMFLDPKSFLNDRTDHGKDGPRFNTRLAAKIAGKRTKKQTTFNQLLVQHKILDEAGDKKPRDRPWLVKQTVTYSSDSDTEDDMN